MRVSRVSVWMYVLGCLPVAAAVLSVPIAHGGEMTSHPGYRFLTEKAYIPPDFDQETFDNVWRVWPEPLRSQAAAASVEQRRTMAFSRYGLTVRPGSQDGKPLQYVVDRRGNWSINCFACHAGKVLGKPIPGLPNSHYGLQTLTEETRLAKLQLRKELGRMDVGSLFMPLGTTVGTTNAVMFGVALMAQRDADLNLLDNVPLPAMMHHDMDPPAWWHFKKRTNIYIDGFAPKGHRALMQFMLVKQNGPDKFRQWEADYRQVYSFLESLEPPKYPFSIDRELAAEGERVFNDACAQCHGTYGAQWSYPNRLVSIEEIGTDRVRLDALTDTHRRDYGRSWFARRDKEQAMENPGGYVAPPLDGVWASAPYFHNGSVPTLWHVLHSEERPTVWRRTEDGYDRQQVGLEIETFERIPSTVRSAADLRHYFDTRRFGKSNQGHTFPDQLSGAERRAVLEYLKTL